MKLLDVSFKIYLIYGISNISKKAQEDFALAHVWATYILIAGSDVNLKIYVKIRYAIKAI